MVGFFSTALRASRRDNEIRSFHRHCLCLTSDHGKASNIAAVFNACGVAAENRNGRHQAPLTLRGRRPDEASAYTDVREES